MSGQVYIDNFCLVDPTKAIKDDKLILTQFLRANSFEARLEILNPVLEPQFRGFQFQSLWPIENNRKQDERSELYRLSGNKAFAKGQSRRALSLYNNALSFAENDSQTLIE